MIQQVLHYLRRMTEALEAVQAVDADHTHDDQYYTESEVGGLLADKVDVIDTRDISTSGDIESGRGSGGVALTINDGFGNANLTFNHKNGIPEQTGNAGRIEVNTDGGTPLMSFELGEVTGGEAVNLPSIMHLQSNRATFYQPAYHNDDPYLSQATADSLYAPIGGGGGGLSVSYGLVRDEKPQGVEGGAFTAGAWRTRDLNTIVHGSEYLSLSNNVLTIEAGEYFIRIQCPALLVERHVSRFFCVDDDSVALVGTAAFCSERSQTSSFILGRLSLSIPNSFIIQHRCETSRSPNGLGVSSYFSVSIYATVEIWRLT